MTDHATASGHPAATDSAATPAAVGRWASYSLAASAGVAAAVGNAEASDIVYSGEQDISIAQFSALNLNLDGDASNDVLLKNYVFGANYQGLTVNYAPGKVVGFSTGLNYATALAAGDMIDAAATAGGPFVASLAYGNNPDSQFDSIDNAFIGLEFPVGPITFFGWIRVSIDNAAGTFIVHDWAYNQIGDGIEAGAIPTPGSLAFLAAGAAGLGMLRRRRDED